MAVLPTQASLEAFAAKGDGRPVMMLNLLRHADGDRSLEDEVVYSGACSTEGSEWSPQPAGGG